MSRLAMLILLALIATTMWAQSTAALVGNVTDSTGGTVPNATVKITNTRTGYSVTRPTGATGNYTFTLLPVGEYRLEVEAQGFQRHVRQGIVLAVNERPTIDVVLAVGTVSEAVTVTGAAPLLETQSGTLKGLVDQERIVSLPLNGRNMPELLRIQAGVISRGGSNREGYIYNVNGSRQNGVAYLMDSGYNTDSYRNYSGVFPNPDAVQEFSLQKSNFSAEYANATGAIVNVVTRSGTNDLHGSAFLFNRNKVFNARNFFAANRDTLKRNQFGGTIGGPIVKDKLFFFATYQSTYLRSDPQLSRIFLPTTRMRAGDFGGQSTVRDITTGQPFPGNQIPLSRYSSVALNWLKYLPDPGTPDGQILSGTPTQIDTSEYMGRIDYNLEKHRFTGKYFYQKEHQGLAISKENVALPQTRDSSYPYWHISVNHIYTLSPTKLNSATFSFRKRTTTLSWLDTEFPIDMVRAGVKGLAFHPPEFYLAVSGYFTASVGQFYEKRDHDVHVADTFTWFRGKHEIKIGGEIIRSGNDIDNHFRTMGQFEFNGANSGHAMADFLLGDMYRFLQGGGEYKDLRGTRYGLFVQDDFRASNKLTLNLGLRWDPVFPFHDKLGRVQCFRPGQQSTRFPNAPLNYLSAGDAGCPEGGFGQSLGTVSPRLGFAWRPAGKTVIRGGVGIFWNPQFTVLYNTFVNSAPFSPQVELFGRRFEDPYGSNPNPFPQSFAPFTPARDSAFFPPLGTFGSFDPGFRPSYTQSYNLTVEREIATNLITRVSYIGNMGRQLSYNKDVNFAVYAPGATLANLQQRRPHRQFTGIQETAAGSNSSYHGLQVSVERRMTRGFSVEANYTWSKSIDEWSFDPVPGQQGSITPPFSRLLNRGLSEFDIRHRFVASYVWSLPALQGKSALVKGVLGGWQHTAIWTLQGGFPFNVLSGVDNALSGINSDRADLVGNPYLDTGRPRAELITEYFSRSAFRTNQLGTFGTTPRMAIIGPGTASVDVAFMKNFAVKEKVQLQFRGEFFNLFNRPNFSNPYNVHRVANRFGRLESAGDPRIGQLALKVSF
ncbi:MAG: TonB-dependent receptor [Bryobacterales bacterium]|nr:TonB-dependent receptor [Bryobacterales bacterium]